MEEGRDNVLGGGHDVKKGYGPSRRMEKGRQMSG